MPRPTILPALLFILWARSVQTWAAEKSSRTSDGPAIDRVSAIKEIPASDLSIAPGSIAYEPPHDPEGLESQLAAFRDFNGRRISDGAAFRETRVKTPEVLTFRIKRFFLEKILAGEKLAEFRPVGRQNNALIQAGIARSVRFLRLHFQDNDVQLLSRIERIDIVTGEEAAEPWDKEQGTETGDTPHWRIQLSDPRLLWNNPKSRALERRLRSRASQD